MDKKCCPGWEGKDCKEAVCKDTCKNGGLCLKPGQCSCPDKYVGRTCEDEISAVDSQSKYCYQREDCDGERKDGYEGLTTKDECCRGKAGSWGLAEGSDASSCKPCGAAKIGDKTYMTTAKNENYNFATCVSYGINNFRTFDGLRVAYKARCIFTMVKDRQSQMYVKIEFTTCWTASSCKKIIYVKTYSGLFVISGMKVTYKDDVSLKKFETNLENDEVFPPESLATADKIRRNKAGDNYLDAAGGIVSLKWDSRGHNVFITMTKAAVEKTKVEGICGNFDEDPLNDFETAGQGATLPEFFLYYKESSVVCPDGGSTVACKNEADKIAATERCSPFKTKFAFCGDKYENVNSWFDDCVNAHCQLANTPGTTAEDLDEAVCDLAACLSRLCAEVGMVGEWRSQKFCPKTCPNGLVFKEAASTCDLMFCGQVKMPAEECKKTHPDCVCPTGTLMYKSKCIEPKECPCIFKGKEYVRGDRVYQGCRECECAETATRGTRWICPNTLCTQRCTVFGNAIIPFIGDLYHIDVGSCPMEVLAPRPDHVQDAKANIVITSQRKDCESGKCLISIKIIVGDNLTMSVTPTGGSGEALLIVENGKVITTLPHKDDVFTIRKPTNLYYVIEVLRTVTLEYNGDFRTFYVRAKPYLLNKMMGLCSTIDEIGNIYATSAGFTVNKEKFVESHAHMNSGENQKLCSNLNWVPQEGPCASNDARREEIMKKCSRILDPSGPFGKCLKDQVDLQSYYTMCVSEMCGNKEEDSLKTMCAAYSIAGRKCSSEGVTVDWILQESECRSIFNCVNKEYVECSENCHSACADVQARVKCNRYECVPGCRCPKGLLTATDSDGNRGRVCIERSKCKCKNPYQEKGVLQPGDVISLTCLKCVCENALLTCTKKDDKKCTENVTCPTGKVHFKNPQQIPTQMKCGQDFAMSTETANRPLCVCPQGKYRAYTSDGNKFSCVEVNKCPCYKPFMMPPNSEFNMGGCAELKCINGVVQKIRDIDCYKTCHAIGDPHYRSFDGKAFSIQGTCKYLLLDLKLHNVKIYAKNEQCGTTGVTCTKSVEMLVDGLKIVLSRDRPITAGSLTINNSDKQFLDGDLLYKKVGQQKIVIESHSKGFKAEWDGLTTLRIGVMKKHRFKINGGLCGDYDGNPDNDFTTSTNGLTESADTFASSWASEECKQDVKPPGDDVQPCHGVEYREAWAKQMCGIIKDTKGVFKDCLEVNPMAELFYKWCQYDACRCDRGGDCECLCTVLAAFAETCSNLRMPAKWRSQKLCPIMCEGGAIYRPYGPYCQETCMDLSLGRNITDECKNTPNGLEGCFCPEGTVLEATSVPTTTITPCLSVSAMTNKTLIPIENINIKSDGKNETDDKKKEAIRPGQNKEPFKGKGPIEVTVVLSETTAKELDLIVLLKTVNVKSFSVQTRKFPTDSLKDIDKGSITRQSQPGTDNKFSNDTRIKFKPGSVAVVVQIVVYPIDESDNIELQVKIKVCLELGSTTTGTTTPPVTTTPEICLENAKTIDYLKSDDVLVTASSSAPLNFAKNALEGGGLFTWIDDDWSQREVYWLLKLNNIPGSNPIIDEVTATIGPVGPGLTVKFATSPDGINWSDRATFDNFMITEGKTIRSRLPGTNGDSFLRIAVSGEIEKPKIGGISVHACYESEATTTTTTAATTSVSTTTKCTEYQCNTGECIKNTSVCNGEFDCPGREDEYDCTSVTTTSVPTTTITPCLSVSAMTNKTLIPIENINIKSDGKNETDDKKKEAIRPGQNKEPFKGKGPIEVTVVLSETTAKELDLIVLLKTVNVKSFSVQTRKFPTDSLKDIDKGSITRQSQPGTDNKFSNDTRIKFKPGSVAVVVQIVVYPIDESDNIELQVKIKVCLELGSTTTATTTTTTAATTSVSTTTKCTEYQCNTGECIKNTSVCNGEFDCPGREDEYDCTSVTTTSVPTTTITPCLSVSAMTNKTLIPIENINIKSDGKNETDDKKKEAIRPGQNKEPFKGKGPIEVTVVLSETTAKELDLIVLLKTVNVKSFSVQTRKFPTDSLKDIDKGSITRQSQPGTDNKFSNDTRIKFKPGSVAVVVQIVVYPIDESDNIELQVKIKVCLELGSTTTATTTTTTAATTSVSTTTKCTEYQCNTGECIKNTSVCNGEFDCPGREDEYDCTSVTTTSVPTTTITPCLSVSAMTNKTLIPIENINIKSDGKNETDDKKKEAIRPGQNKEPFKGKGPIEVTVVLSETTAKELDLIVLLKTVNVKSFSVQTRKFPTDSLKDIDKGSITRQSQPGTDNKFSNDTRIKFKPGSVAVVVQIVVYPIDESDNIELQVKIKVCLELGSTTTGTTTPPVTTTPEICLENAKTIDYLKSDDVLVTASSSAPLNFAKNALEGGGLFTWIDDDWSQREVYWLLKLNNIPGSNPIIDEVTATIGPVGPGLTVKFATSPDGINWSDRATFDNFMITEGKTIRSRLPGTNGDSFLRIAVSGEIEKPKIGGISVHACYESEATTTTTTAATTSVSTTTKCTEYQCNTGECIKNTSVCNGEFDCPGREDEYDCTSVTTTSVPTTTITPCLSVSAMTNKTLIPIENINIKSDGKNETDDKKKEAIRPGQNKEPFKGKGPIEVTVVLSETTAKELDLIVLLKTVNVKSFSVQTRKFPTDSLKDIDEGSITRQSQPGTDNRFSNDTRIKFKPGSVAVVVQIVVYPIDESDNIELQVKIKVCLELGSTTTATTTTTTAATTSVSTTTKCTEYQCNTGECIKNTSVCNGEFDCPGREDEYDCTSVTTTSVPTTTITPCLSVSAMTNKTLIPIENINIKSDGKNETDDKKKEAIRPGQNKEPFKGKGPIEVTVVLSETTAKELDLIVLLKTVNVKSFSVQTRKFPTDSLKDIDKGSITRQSQPGTDNKFSNDTRIKFKPGSVAVVVQIVVYPIDESDNIELQVKIKVCLELGSTTTGTTTPPVTTTPEICLENAKTIDYLKSDDVLVTASSSAPLNFAKNALEGGGLFTWIDDDWSQREVYWLLKLNNIPGSNPIIDEVTATIGPVGPGLTVKFATSPDGINWSDRATFDNFMITEGKTIRSRLPGTNGDSFLRIAVSGEIEKPKIGGISVHACYESEATTTTTTAATTSVSTTTKCTEYQCNTGECIKNTSVCNGEFDCPGREDEYDCTSVTTTSVPTTTITPCLSVSAMTNKTLIPIENINIKSDGKNETDDKKKEAIRPGQNKEPFKGKGPIEVTVVLSETTAKELDLIVLLKTVNVKSFSVQTRKFPTDSLKDIDKGSITRQSQPGTDNRFSNDTRIKFKPGSVAVVVQIVVYPIDESDNIELQVKIKVCLELGSTTTATTTTTTAATTSVSTTTKCTEYQCNTGECIKNTSVCNGEFDCPGREDEYDCTSVTTTSVPTTTITPCLSVSAMTNKTLIPIENINIKSDGKNETDDKKKEAIRPGQNKEPFKGKGPIEVTVVLSETTAKELDLIVLLKTVNVKSFSVQTRKFPTDSLKDIDKGSITRQSQPGTDNRFSNDTRIKFKPGSVAVVVQIVVYPIDESDNIELQVKIKVCLELGSTTTGTTTPPVTTTPENPCLEVDGMTTPLIIPDGSITITGAKNEVKYLRPNPPSSNPVKGLESSDGAKTITITIAFTPKIVQLGSLSFANIENIDSFKLTTDRPGEPNKPVGKDDVIGPDKPDNTNTFESTATAVFNAGTLVTRITITVFPADESKPFSLKSKLFACFEEVTTSVSTTTVTTSTPVPCKEVEGMSSGDINAKSDITTDNQDSKPEDLTPGSANRFESDQKETELIITLVEPGELPVEVKKIVLLNQTGINGFSIEYKNNTDGSVKPLDKKTNQIPSGEKFDEEEELELKEPLFTRVIKIIVYQEEPDVAVKFYLEVFACFPVKNTTTAPPTTTTSPTATPVPCKEVEGMSSGDINAKSDITTDNQDSKPEDLTPGSANRFESDQKETELIITLVEPGELPVEVKKIVLLNQTGINGFSIEYKNNTDGSVKPLDKKTNQIPSGEKFDEEEELELKEPLFTRVIKIIVYQEEPDVAVKFYLEVFACFPVKNTPCDITEGMNNPAKIPTESIKVTGITNKSEIEKLRKGSGDSMVTKQSVVTIDIDLGLFPTEVHSLHLLERANVGTLNLQYQAEKNGPYQTVDKSDDILGEPFGKFCVEFSPRLTGAYIKLSISGDGDDVPHIADAKIMACFEGQNVTAPTTPTKPTTITTKCASGTVYCGNNVYECGKQCDNITDCDNSLDELNCTCIEPDIPAINCSIWFLKKSCFEPGEICDGECECDEETWPNCQDEVDCATTTTGAPPATTTTGAPPATTTTAPLSQCTEVNGMSDPAIIPKDAITATGVDSVDLQQLRPGGPPFTETQDTLTVSIVVNKESDVEVGKIVIVTTNVRSVTTTIPADKFVANTNTFTPDQTGSTVMLLVADVMLKNVKLTFTKSSGQQAMTIKLSVFACYEIVYEPKIFRLRPRHQRYSVI
ncbi:mucin-2-like [Lineus longissimus]|uniref:mucin-2-like n=1 Tax=Lineus longissimus TaxID=88925 RepID=UPI00315CBF29